MYFVYILRCRDGSCYTGVSSDWRRRLREHMSGGSRAARYTRSHPAEGLAALWATEDKSSALRMEYRIKALRKEDKMKLIRHPECCRELLPGLGGPEPEALPPSLWESVSPAPAGNTGAPPR